ALLAGFFLPVLLVSRQVLILAAGLYLMVGLTALSRGRAGRPVRGILLLLLAGPLMGWMMPDWDPALFASGPSFNGPHYMAAVAATDRSLTQVLHQRGGFLYTAEGPDALVTIRELPGGGASLQINGRTEASTGPDLRAQVLAAQFPLLHLGHLDRALVIGLASGVTAGSVLTRHPAELVIAELAPTVVAAAKSGAFDDVSGRPLKDNRVRLRIGDARILLQSEPRTYDLIASQPSNPWVPGVAGLYTEEFFQLVRRRLRPAGVFGQWVQAYGLTRTDFRRILRTFSHVFPFCRLYEESVGGGDYFLVGSPSPLERDAAVLLGRLSPAVLKDLDRVGLSRPESLLNRRVLDAAGVRAVSGEGPLLVDDRLRLAYTTPLTFFNETGSDLWDLLEQHRLPAIREYDLSHLDSDARRTMAARLVQEDRMRREDRSFLSLLERGDLEVLGQPTLALALSLARAGLTRAAYLKLRRALENSPGPPLLEVLAGDLALRLGQSDEAEAHYQRALSRRPESAAALTGLGLLRMASGAPEQARPLFAAALAAEPLSERALLGLGSAELAQGNLEAASEHLQRAVEQAPDLPEGWSNLGVCRRRMGRWAEAEEAYRRAVTLDPGLARAWFNLGVLLEARNRPVDALEVYQEGLKSIPGDVDLVQALERLAPMAGTKGGEHTRPGTLRP
ncbi:MAG: tetratricopeptide repeat protein, partial [Acidobacteriota bacterium]